MPDDPATDGVSMTTKYLNAPCAMLRNTVKNVEAVIAAVRAANDYYEVCGYAHRFTVAYDGTGHGVDLNDAGMMYQYLPKELHGEWKAAIDRAMGERMWMTTYTKGYRKIGEVFKGSLANRVGHIGWIPGAKRTTGVMYACFGQDGNAMLAEFTTMAKAKAFMLQRARSA